MADYSFDEKYSQGDDPKIEKMVIRFIKSVHPGLEIQKVTGSVEQKKGDYKVMYPGGFPLPLYFEKKTERRYQETGNVALETKSNIEKGTKGCLEASECDYFIFILVNGVLVNGQLEHDLLLLDRTRLLATLNRMDSSWRQKYKKYTSTEGLYHTELYAVPKEELLMEYNRVMFC